MLGSTLASRSISTMLTRHLDMALIKLLATLLPCSSTSYGLAPRFNKCRIVSACPC